MRAITKKREESGFVLLLVLVMAATVGIMLYTELPRLVFESQRIKEQDLINRGEEYKRAIQLYVRKFKKYPASIDDLETGTEMRFLRRRYKDPMTGKAEWRLVHIDNAGFYTDSLIHKRKEEKEKKSENTFITEGAAFGSNQPPPGQAGAQKGGAAVRGASDRPAAQASQFYGTSPPGTPPAPGQPPYANQPYATPGQPARPGQPGQATAPYPIQGVPGLTGPYGQPRPGTTAPNQGVTQYPGQAPAQPYGQPGQTPYPRQGIPGLPGRFGQQPRPANPSSNPVQANPYVPFGGTPTPARPRQPAPRPGFGAPGMGRAGPAQPRAGGLPGSAAPNRGGALGMIQQLLTRPRPGGLQGLSAAGTTGLAGGGGIAGGIAGVATTVESEGIMVYNKHTKYNEWEFLYDYREDQQQAAASAARGAGIGGQRNPLGGQQGAQRSPLGGSSAFGGSGSAFGRGGSSSSGSGSSFGGGGSSFGGRGSFGGRPTPPPPTGNTRRP